MQTFSRTLFLLIFFCFACNTYTPHVPAHITQGGSKVKVKKVANLPPTSSITYERFGQALRHLDLEAAAVLADMPIKREILKSFQYFSEGDRMAMKKQLKFLIEEGEDENAKTLSTHLFYRLFYLESQWKKLIEVGQKDEMMLAFASKPAEEIKIKEEQISGKLKLSATGCPIVAVEVNGKKEWFWFDTGASESIISSDLVDALSISRLSGEIDIKSSTSNVEAGFGYVKSLQVGGLELKNHAVLILDKDRLEFELHNGTKEKIRGIIGWPAIRNLRWELDYKAGTFSTQASKYETNKKTNFLWMGYPFVKLHHKDGRALLFGLDTGSNKTSTLESIFNRVPFKGVKEKEVTIGGAGGYESIPSKIISHLPLLLQDHLFTLKDVQMEQINHTFFIELDGTLGSDISLGSRMILDFPKGTFSIIPSR